MKYMIQAKKNLNLLLRIIAGALMLKQRGSGVVTVDGKMVDEPIIIRARRTIDIALTSGLIKRDDVLAYKENAVNRLIP